MSADERFKLILLICSILMLGMLFWVTINIGKNVEDIESVKKTLFEKDYLKREK